MFVLLLLLFASVGVHSKTISVTLPTDTTVNDDKNFTGIAVLELTNYLDAIGFDVINGEADVTVTLTLSTVGFENNDDHRVEVSATLVTISAPTPLALLYGVYTFSEKVLNIKFMMTRDIIPNRLQNPLKLLIPSRVIDMTAGPFQVRGLQPFHDFNSGPDWWSLNDYFSVLSQMVKMKMNFIGFHNYPLKEPMVWVGTPNNVSSGGKVSVESAYSTEWRTTQDAGWGMIPRNTDTYTTGSAKLFPSNCWSSPVQLEYDNCFAATEQDQKKLFDDTLDLMTNIVSHAHSLGIKVAFGTEVPLSMPQGLSTEESFEGIFKRLNNTNMDYYWHWTAEGGDTVNGTTTQQAVKDVATSVDVWKNFKNPSFELAASGWFIGPRDDPTYFDKTYSSSISALSALDLGVGWDPMQPQYQEIKNHTTWVIPWMEDDPGLIGAELWVNRTIFHVKDARKYGTKGVLGIHWRTLEPSLAMSALSQSLWDETLTVEDFYKSFTNSAFPEVSSPASTLLTSLDSFKVGPEAVAPKQCWQSCIPNLPRPQLSCCASWSDIKTNVSDEYSFADTFSSLRSKVSSNNLEVFNEWAYQLSYQKELAILQMTTWKLFEVMGNISLITDPVKRREVANVNGTASMSSVSRSYEKMMTALLSFTSTKGELGMVAQQEGMNWMRNIMPLIFELQQYVAIQSSYSFVGCYKDDSNVRAMLHGPGIVGHSFPHYGVGNCSLVCSEFEYFSIQSSTKCFCSNDHTRTTRYGIATPCNKTDGGMLVNAVYTHQPVRIMPDSVWPTASYLGGVRIYFMMPVTISPRGKSYTYPVMVQSSTQPSSVSLVVVDGGRRRIVALSSSSDGFNFFYSEITSSPSFSYYATCIVDGIEMNSSTVRVVTV